jgi:hypothetical protein
MAGCDGSERTRERAAAHIHIIPACQAFDFHNSRGKKGPIIFPILFLFLFSLKCLEALSLSFLKSKKMF